MNRVYFLGPLVAQESEPQQTLQPIVPVTTTSQTPQTATEITPILPSTQEPTTIQNNIPPNDPDGLLAIHNPPKKKFPPEYNHWPIELVAFYAFLGFTVLYSYFVMSGKFVLLFFFFQIRNKQNAHLEKKKGRKAISP